MSTIMINAASSERLARQFEAAMRRATGRDRNLEARRFVSSLCARLERNNHDLMAAPHNLRPEAVIRAGYACRHGETVMLTCLFLLNDLAVRMGRRRVAECLEATQTRAGRALARRVGTRGGEPRIVGVRFSADHGGWSARDCRAEPAPFAGTGSVCADYDFSGQYPGALKPGLLIDNDGERTSHFVACHVRLFARYDDTAAWTPTPGQAMAFLEKIAPMESQVLALRGFDCMDLIRGADPLNRDPKAIRLIARVL